MGHDLGGATRGKRVSSWENVWNPLFTLSRCLLRKRRTLNSAVPITAPIATHTRGLNTASVPRRVNDGILSGPLRGLIFFGGFRSSRSG